MTQAPQSQFTSPSPAQEGIEQGRQNLETMRILLDKAERAYVSGRKQHTVEELTMLNNLSRQIRGRSFAKQRSGGGFGEFAIGAADDILFGIPSAFGVHRPDTVAAASSRGAGEITGTIATLVGGGALLKGTGMLTKLGTVGKGLEALQRARNIKALRLIKSKELSGAAAAAVKGGAKLRNIISTGRGGAKIGATIGAIQGATGAARDEYGDFTGLGETLGGAASGAVTGGLIGGALGVVGRIPANRAAAAARAEAFTAQTEKAAARVAEKAALAEKKAARLEATKMQRATRSRVKADYKTINFPNGKTSGAGLKRQRQMNKLMNKVYKNGLDDSASSHQMDIIFNDVKAQPLGQQKARLDMWEAKLSKNPTATTLSNHVPGGSRKAAGTKATGTKATGAKATGAKATGAKATGAKATKTKSGPSSTKQSDPLATDKNGNLHPLRGPFDKEGARLADDIPLPPEPPVSEQGNLFSDDPLNYLDEGETY